MIEEKGPFLERLVRDALYGGPATPPVLGTRDDRGAPLVPAHGALDADAIARVVGARLLAHEDLPGVRERLDAARRGRPARRRVELGATRTPFFCSGCPHNSEHGRRRRRDRRRRHRLPHDGDARRARPRAASPALTQMGAEGAQWIGAAPFVDVPHFVQNLGDGTFHHSGSLAIRAAVAAGAQHHLQAARTTATSR